MWAKGWLAPRPKGWDLIAVLGCVDPLMANRTGVIGPMALEAEVTEMKILDRVKEYRKVRACDLLPHPANWRTHPDVQANALRDLLKEIGFAGAVIARELEDGRLQIIDGHLRVETMGRREVGVLVTDLTAKEAEKLLLTYDPLGAMATADQSRLEALLANVRLDSEAVGAMLEKFAGDAAWQVVNQPKELIDPPAQIDKAAEFQKKMGHQNRATMEAWFASASMWRFYEVRRCCAIDERRAGGSLRD